MVLSYLPGASLVPRWLSDGSFPASLVPRERSNESFLAIEIVLKGNPVLRAANGHATGSQPCRICRESPLKLYLEIYKIRRSSKTGIRSAILCANGSFLPPWCLPGASQAVQLILSCLPGASQAVQMVLSCLPGASLVPRWLSDGSRGVPRAGPGLSGRGAVRGVRGLGLLFLSVAKRGGGPRASGTRGNDVHVLLRSANAESARRPFSRARRGSGEVPRGEPGRLLSRALPGAVLPRGRGRKGLRGTVKHTQTRRERKAGRDGGHGVGHRGSISSPTARRGWSSWGSLTRPPKTGRAVAAQAKEESATRVFGRGVCATRANPVLRERL